MASALFGIDSSALQAKLSVRNGAQSFLIDDTDGDLTEAEADVILNNAEELVFSRLKARYRAMMFRIEGEILVRSANDGQTTFNTGLFPITNLKLYLDFDYRYFGWNNRTEDFVLSSDLYTVNETTGAVTLDTGLPLGISVLAEYDHGAASKALTIVDAVVTLAAVEVSRRLRFNDEDGDFTNWENATFTTLEKTNYIRIFDQLNGIFTTDKNNPYAYVKGASDGLSRFNF